MRAYALLSGVAQSFFFFDFDSVWERCCWRMDEIKGDDCCWDAARRAGLSVCVTFDLGLARWSHILHFVCDTPLARRILSLKMPFFFQLFIVHFVCNLISFVNFRVLFCQLCWNFIFIFGLIRSAAYDFGRVTHFYRFWDLIESLALWFLFSDETP